VLETISLLRLNATTSQHSKSHPRLVFISRALVARKKSRHTSDGQGHRLLCPSHYQTLTIAHDLAAKCHHPWRPTPVYENARQTPSEYVRPPVQYSFLQQYSATSADADAAADLHADRQLGVQALPG